MYYVHNIFTHHLGSCALLTLLDTDKRDLYVACVGDSRAVAGVKEADSWGVDVLTQDQTGRNPDEVARSVHLSRHEPSSDAGNIYPELSRNILRRRLTTSSGTVVYSVAWSPLGHLATRSTSGPDKSSICKPPTSIRVIFVLTLASLSDTIAPVGTRPHMLNLLETPPYVIARPAITHRKLALPADPQTGKEMKFIVMATDGLWDQLRCSTSHFPACSVLTQHPARKKSSVSSLVTSPA